MTPSFILWCIPGYIALVLFQLVIPARNRSGWDFVFQVAVMAALCFLLAQLIVILGDSLLPGFTLMLRKWWMSTAAGHLHYSFSLLLGSVVGVPAVGIGTSLLLRKYGNNIVSNYTKRVTGRGRNYEFTDTYFKTCHDLLGKPVLIALNSGKVYVGLLIEATEDPNESQRFIKITPALSGHRDKNSFQVVFTTEYIGAIPNRENLPNRDILIAMSQVSTFSPFDAEIHEKFVSMGTTKMRPGFMNEKNQDKT